MTAFSTPTLADLKASLADRKTNGTVPTDSNTLSLWIRTFNRAVRYCFEKLRVQKTTTSTVASGTAVLPADFAIALDVVDSSGNKLIQISPQDSAGVGGLFYWITYNTDGTATLNSPTDGDYTVHYTYKPAKMASDSDVCPFPDEEAIVAYAYAILRKAESDPFEDADRALAECENRLREIESQYALNDQGNNFKMQYNA
jgi:hypothetical protein